MHITCQQSALDHALATTNHAVSSRSTLPILANVLISAEAGILKLSSTNLEIGINVQVAAEIIEEGTITLPAKLFSEFIHSLPAGSVELVCPEGDVVVASITGSRRSRGSIKGMVATEFPRIPISNDGILPVVLDAALLKEVIDQVAFAAASDDSRPVLTGVKVQIRECDITFASADAFRLAVRVIDLPGDEHPCGDLLIPARTLTELGRILPDEGPVEMIVTPGRSQVLFHTPNLDLVSRLLEGEFPAFERIIPENHLTRAVLSTKDFAAAVKSALLFARDSSNILQVTVGKPETDLGNGCLTVDAMAEDIGDSTGSIEASIEGPEVTMRFNAKYVAEALNAISTPEVALELTYATKPGTLKPVGADDIKQVYVVMPMHINR
jgi:DNA polymerase III subunit beta